MKIIKFNITIPKKYTDRKGNEKKQWNTVGTITEFHKDDGSVSRLVEIPAIGLEANAFPVTPKNESSEIAKPVETETEEIAAEDLPF